MLKKIFAKPENYKGGLAGFSPNNTNTQNS